MGDLVQTNLDSTQDIIEFKSSKLFTDSEIGNIIQNRNSFDYKINSIPKCLQDVKAAIQYENSVLLELMKHRRARNMPIKKQALDFLIIKRIQNLYSTALVDFPEDYELHLDYYNFMRQHQSFNTAVNEHVRKMIEKFEHNPQIFRVAASKKRYNKEAVEILLRGWSRHPEDLELYVDLITLELKEPDKYKLQEKLMKYVDDILKNIPGHVFLIKTLKLLEPCPHLLPVQNYIISNLLEKYWSEEEIWHYVALRELQGFYYKASPEEEANKTNRKSIKRCVARYKEGLSKLFPKKQPGLWKLYLNTVIGLQKDIPNVAIVFRNNLLKQTLDDARRANFPLDEDHWDSWIDACESNDELLVEKLDEATEEQPQSTMLWSIYLKYYILKDKAEQSERIFGRAVRALRARAAFIWDMYIDYHLLKTSLSDVNYLYRKAVSEPYEEISSIFKPRYLAWTVLSYNIAEGRKVYWEMATGVPYCRELHEEMMQIELMELDYIDLNNQTKVMALYADQFGDNDVDVWLQWISMNREQRALDQNEKEMKIFEHAVTVLPGKMANEFRKKYNALSL